MLLKSWRELDNGRRSFANLLMDGPSLLQLFDCFFSFPLENGTSILFHIIYSECMLFLVYFHSHQLVFSQNLTRHKLVFSVFHILPSAYRCIFLLKWYKYGNVPPNKREPIFIAYVYLNDAPSHQEELQRIFPIRIEMYKPKWHFSYFAYKHTVKKTKALHHHLLLTCWEETHHNPYIA